MLKETCPYGEPLHDDPDGCPACEMFEGEDPETTPPPETELHHPAARSGADRGTAQRLKDSKRVYRETRDPRAAIREYCRGNKWLEENAKAVGNW
jgi:hypothetical protein